MTNSCSLLKENPLARGLANRGYTKSEIYIQQSDSEKAPALTSILHLQSTSAMNAASIVISDRWTKPIAKHSRRLRCEPSADVAPL
jgi:hypothetical protein